MLIKEDIKQSKVITRIKAHSRFKHLMGLFVLLSYTGVMILLGGNLHKEGFFGEVLKPLIQENIKIPVNYIKGIFSEPEELTIDIKHTDYQKLAYKRKIALQEGVLHPFRDDFVPAKIHWNKNTIKANIRLKGDLGDHWSRDHKWSFRIKAKGDNSIMGMSNFSLQHPRTRGFLNDWFLHKILQDKGFITLRYDFVDVTINGRHLGIYAIEEHFERRLIENNKHINGPIVRIKDHLLWYLVDPKTGFKREHLDELYSSSPIDAFNTNTVSNNEVLLENYNKAKNLFEAFRRGKLLTHQVFDIDKIANIFAIIDLFGYRHTTAYSNIRFYYNPITSLLEPIGYDNTFIEEADSIEGQEKVLKVSNSVAPERLDWRKTFFKDEIFFRRYVQALVEISEKNYLDELFNKTQKDYEEKLNIIYSNFPGYNFSKQKEKLYKNQEFIKNILNPLEGIQAYYKSIDENTGTITLQIGNIQFLPVELIDANYGEYKFKLLNNYILQSKTRFKPIDFQEVQYKIPKGITLSEGFVNNLKVNYKIIGTSYNKEISVFNWTYYDDDFLKTDFIRQKPNHHSFAFIEVDDDTNIISIKRGEWNINKSIIIPYGYTVICREGTKLNMSESAKILSYSPLDFVGTDSNKIIINSIDSTGQGIVVINANNKSNLKNVIFQGLSPPSQDGWSVPGAITFYESDVNIEKSSFIGNESGVGLSIIRSEFNITKSYFLDTYTDSLSVIFGKGKISNTTIKDSKRNGLYSSGSVINIENILIDNVHNAGIKASDKSIIIGTDIEIYSTEIAVISKDSSDVNMKNTKIVDSELALYCAQEKQEFGPASINVNNLSTRNVKKESLIQDGSMLKIN